MLSLALALAASALALRIEDWDPRIVYSSIYTGDCGADLPSGPCSGTWALAAREGMSGTIISLQRRVKIAEKSGERTNKVVPRTTQKRL